jgi:PAS domain S-box-containing protein
MITVLYVDDEPGLLELGKAFLERDCNFSVTTVTSAPDALALMAGYDFDLVLSDYQMPVMDGITFLQEVRSRYPSLPFILFTGRGREEIVIQAINNGVDFYLQKGGDPLAQFAELAHKIAVAVERRQVQNALRDSEQRLTDIINFLPDATFAINTEGTVIAWNRAIEDMTDVSASVMAGRGNHEYALPFYGNRRQLLIDLILESEDVIQRSEFLIIKKEGDVLIAETTAASVRGEPKIFLCKASLLYNKEGNVAGAIESIRDITEARKAEDELRAAYEQITASEEEMRQQYEDLEQNQVRLREANEQITAQEEELRGQYDEMSALQQRTAESQQMLAQVLDTVPVRVFWKDRDLRYLGCNEPFARDAGFSAPADLIGKTDFEMGWKELAELYRADDRNVIESGIPKIGYEEPQTTPDGTRIWLRTSKIPLRDPGGTITGVLGTYEDITETRQAEEALRKSEETFRSLVQESSEGIVIADEDGKVIAWNHALADITGIPAGEALGSSYAGLVVSTLVPEHRTPDHIGRIKSIIAEKDQMGISWFFSRHLEIEILRRDGMRRFIQQTAFPIRTPRGIRIGSIIRDITESRKAAVALRESEEKYRSVIENIQDIFYRSDRDGNLVMASPSCLKILGYDSLEEVLNRRIATVFYYRPEKRDELLSVLVEKGYLEDYEVQLKRKDGSPVWVSTYSHYYRGPDGNIAGIEGVFRDISRRKQVEDGMHAANEQITAQSEELASQLEEMEKANRALARSEENFQSLVENAPDAIYISVGQQFVYVNAAFVRMMGATSRDQLLGMSLYERIHPDYHEAARGRADLITVQRKAGALRDMVYRRMNGTPVDVESSVAPFRFHGQVAGLIILRDISERKRAQGDLQKSELRFRRLLEQSFDAAVIHQDGVIVFANEPAAGLLNVDGPSDLTGKPVMDFVDPVSEKIVRERIRTMAESPYSIVPPVEERFRRPDGTTIDAEVIASPTVYGQKPAVLVLFRDISNRKAAEIALKESENRYRQILQHASDAIIIHEVTRKKPGRLIEVNRKACEMLGYSRDELLRMSIPDIDAPEQAGKVPEIQHRLFAGETVVFPAEHIAKDGKRIPVEVSNSLIELEGRTVVMAVIRDMRKQKRTEQVLRETNRKLALLSSITRHDLRNKVTALAGYLDLAKEKSGNPVMQEFIEKLEPITDSISGHIEYTRIYEDLGSVEPLWQDLRGIIASLEVPPELTLVNGLPPVMVFGDPIISTVFSNLVDNTVRHGKHATTIRVSAAGHPEGLVIAWEDNGTGIPVKQKEKIFSQGYGKNTGLGLFLSREILAITGITIRETGVPKKGARFEILVPDDAYRFTGSGGE